jgi:hypothetical protein
VHSRNAVRFPLRRYAPPLCAQCSRAMELNAIGRRPGQFRTDRYLCAHCGLAEKIVHKQKPDASGVLVAS